MLGNFLFLNGKNRAQHKYTFLKNKEDNCGTCINNITQNWKQETSLQTDEEDKLYRKLQKKWAEQDIRGKGYREHTTVYLRGFMEHYDPSNEDINII